MLDELIRRCRDGDPASFRRLYDAESPRRGLALRITGQAALADDALHDAFLQVWLAAAEINAGPVFRPVLKGGRISPSALSAFRAAQIVKHYAERAGLDPAAYAGHSLRSGFLTSAAEAGASVLKMVEVSRHKSVDTLRGYVQRADLFREHAGAAFL